MYTTDLIVHKYYPGGLYTHNSYDSLIHKWSWIDNTHNAEFLCNYSLACHDFSEHFVFLIAAADRGSQYAVKNLYKEYATDSHLRQNYSATTVFFTANTHYSYSCSYLAYIYEHGIFFDKDIEKAIELYQKAVQMGNPIAMNNLARIYIDYNLSGTNIPAKSDIYKIAVKLFGMAIDYDDTNAMNNLAQLYSNGHFVEKKYRQGYQTISKIYLIEKYCCHE